MGRKPKSTIYERIEEVQNELAASEENTRRLKAYLEELLKEKDEQEKQKFWEELKKSGLSIDEVRNILKLA